MATAGGGCRQAGTQVTGDCTGIGNSVCALQDGAAARKADMKRREKEEAAAAAALRSLAAKEAQQATLLTARLELESLRVLLERIGRRERIKMQGAQTCPHTLSTLVGLWWWANEKHGGFG